MNRYQKLFSNTVILSIGTIGSKLLVFLLMPLYTALLSTEQYGQAELVTSLASLLIPVACVGISNGIFRFAAEKNEDKKSVFSTSVVILLAGLVVFTALSPLLNLIPNVPGMAVLVALYVIFADLQAVCAQYVRATDRAGLFASQGIFNTVVTILFNLLFLWGFRMGAEGYVLSVVCGNILTTVLLIFVGKLWQDFSWKSVNRKMVSDLIRFSLPMIPATVCWLLTDLSDRYMVSYFCGYDVNGVYSAAYKIPTIVNLLTGIFMQAWQFSAVSESDDKKGLSDFYGKVFRGLLSVIFIGSSLLIVCSGFLTKLLLNVRFADAAIYMPTLLCAVAAEAIVSFLATVYLVQKKTVNSFLTALLGTILNIFLNSVLIPREGLFGGALGAAIATLTAYLAVLVVRLIDVPGRIPFKAYPWTVFASMLILILQALIRLYFGNSVFEIIPIILILELHLPNLFGSIKQILKRFTEKQKAEPTAAGNTER